MNRMDDLKPCPFCGRKALIVKSWNSGAYVRCSNGYKCGARQEWFDSEKEAVEAWNRRAKQQWIPCSERLPEKDGRYQVTRYDYVANTEFIDILWYEENLWWNRHSTGDYAVTAWMPLPEPYREEGKQE